MKRYQTSLGRDLEKGIRLDRNEKVSDFSSEIMEEIYGIFKNYSLCASPESQPLYKKIAKTLNISDEYIFVTNGITEGIRILHDFCTLPGDNVVCLDPTYPMYWIYSEMYQVNFRKFIFDSKTLIPKMDTLYNQLDKNTRFVFIPNPNLPIENCFTINEIRDIAEKCRTNNTMLVIDEAYHYFGAPSVLELIHEFENLIVFRTFSKAYGLAGLRIGFMLSQPQNIKNISKSRSIVESNTFSMQIAEYFLEHSELRDRHIAEVKEGSIYLQNELSKLNIRWHGGKFTNGILIFLKNAESSKELVSYLMEKEIYIRGSFEPPFDSTIRVSIGSKKYMKKFINSFKKWMI